MKNILLTEEQFNILLRQKLLEAFNAGSGVEEAETKFAKDNGGRIINYLNRLYNGGDDNELSNNLRRLANQHAVNFDFSDDEFNEKLKADPQKMNNEIKNWVKQYLEDLRSCYVKNSFMKSKEVARYDSGTNSIKNSYSLESNFDRFSDEKKKNVVNLASFLDKVGLSSIYRDYQNPPSKRFVCGLDLKYVNKNTPVDDIIKKLNFSGIATGEENYSEDELAGLRGELKKYYGDNRAEKINNLAGFGDSKDRSKSDNEWGSVESVAAGQLAEKRAKLYLRSTYGMNLSFGNENKMFKYGNTKVYKDTLIVNFTSAIRCPAWNECIMKDACYAKTSEINYDNTLYSNIRKNLIWEQTKVDKTLMRYMMALLRSYLFDYSKLDIYKGYKKGEEKDDFMWELCQKTLYEIRDEYGEEAINTLRDTKSGKLIRLNENGDFIGQWLVDAFEAFAKEFNDTKVGVHITAYTCRALNYEAVENMILNISQQKLVDKQNSKGFAHFFYAVDPREYAKLGETYGGPNYEMDFNEETKKITPVYRKLIDENGELKGYYYKCPCGRGKFEYVDIQNTKSSKSYTLKYVNGLHFNENRGTFEGEASINGQRFDASIIGTKKFRPKLIYDPDSNVMYIKNGKSVSYSVLDNEKIDFGTYNPATIDANSPDIYINVEEGKIYKKIKSQNPINVADCYMCRICYARDAEGEVKFEGGNRVEGVPIYVFVATHGANKNEFQSPEGRKIDGKTAGEWADILNNRTSSQNLQESAYEDSETLQEEPKSDKLAIKCIVNNFTFSLQQRMANIGPKLNEIKDNFNSILSRING